jgi:hypothetical protein
VSSDIFIKNKELYQAILSNLKVSIFLLDLDLGWYSGAQYPSNKNNFGLFLDSITKAGTLDHS